MPKEPNRTELGLASFAKQVGHHRKVVIVNPNPIVGRDNFARRVGEFLVDACVVAELLGIEMGPTDKEMTERPKRSVGESVRR